MASPAGRAAELDAAKIASPAEAARLFHISNVFIAGYLVLLAFVLALRGLRTVHGHRSHGIAVTDPDGRVANVPPGSSVLDAATGRTAPAPSLHSARWCIRPRGLSRRPAHSLGRR